MWELVPLGHNKVQTTHPTPKGPHNSDAKTRHKDMNNSQKNQWLVNVWKDAHNL